MNRSMLITLAFASLLFLGIVPVPDGTCQRTSDACPTPLASPSIRDAVMSEAFPITERMCMDADGVYVYPSGYSQWDAGIVTNPLLIKAGYVYKILGRFSGWYETYSIMKFDVDLIESQVPYMKQFLKAELVLTPENSTDLGDVVVYRVGQDWSMEQMMEKGNLKANTFSINRSMEFSAERPTQVGQRYHWNITDLWTAWKEEIIPNQGLSLHLRDLPFNDWEDPAPDPLQNISHYYRLDTVLDENEAGPMTPALLITYIGNMAPVASINVEDEYPTVGTPVTLTASAMDPDGDNVTMYRWWSDDGIIGEGADMTSVDVELDQGTNEVYLSVKDDDPDMPRWSETASTTVVVHWPEEKAPLVRDLRCSVNGTEGTTFPQGSMLLFTVQENEGTPGLFGTISVLGTRLWVNHEVLDDWDNGSYTYLWNTKGCPAGTYSVDVVLEDLETGLADMNGLQEGVDLKITLQDVIPPFIENVYESKGAVNGVIQPGDPVTIRVEEMYRESGLDGSITITGNDRSMEYTLSPTGPGIYTCIWDTIGWPEGTYSLDAVLEDDYGNKDMDGVDALDPDLVLKISDTVAPEVVSVVAVMEGDSAYIMVQTAKNEEGLEGIVTVEGPQEFEIDLEDQGEGTYTATVDTQFLESGIYEVNVLIWDINSNTDPDGSESDPDAAFTVRSRNLPPEVVELFPAESQVMDNSNFDISVTFSEPVSHQGDLRSGLRVWDTYGREIPGNVRLEGGGTILIFDPLNPWSPGLDFNAIISSDFSDDEGLRLSGFVSWTFSTESSNQPEITNVYPSANPVLETGSRQQFNVSGTYLDDFAWYLDGKKVEGSQSYEFDAQSPGTYVLEFRNEDGEGTKGTVWKISVFDNSTDEVIADDEDGAVDDEGMDLILITAAVIAAVAVMLLVLSLLMRIRGRGKDDEGTKTSMDGSGLSTSVKKAGQEPVVKKAGQEPVVKKAGQEPVVRKAGQEPVVRKAGQGPVVRKAVQNVEAGKPLPPTIRKGNV